MFGFFLCSPWLYETGLNFIMAVSASPSPDLGAESNHEEIIQELRHELAQSKRQLREVKEKLLISEATAYSLANQLQKYGKFYIGSQSPNE